MLRQQSASARTALVLIVLAAPTRVAVGQCTPVAQRLIDERKFDEAKALVSKSPNDDQAVHCLGMIAVQTNRGRDAVELFEHAAKLNDNSSAHHLWLGNALGNMADSTSKFKLPFLARRIKSELDRAVELDPRSADARHGLIQFYDQAPAIMGGNVDKAKQQAREIGKLDPLRGHLEMAEILMRDGKVADAEQEMVTAERESPDTSAAPLALANFYASQKRWTDAFATYDRVLKKFPGEVSVHYAIGRTAAVSGAQLARGEREMIAWLAAPPKSVTQVNLSNGHWRLGNIYEKEGRKDLARAEYTTALALFPENDNAKKSLSGLK